MKSTAATTERAMRGSQGRALLSPEQGWRGVPMAPLRDGHVRMPFRST